MYEPIGHTTVVEILRRNGGSASFREIETGLKSNIKGSIDDGITVSHERMVYLDLQIKNVVEDLERNGLIENIDGELFTLSDMV